MTGRGECNGKPWEPWEPWEPEEPGEPEEPEEPEEEDMGRFNVIALDSIRFDSTPIPSRVADTKGCDAMRCDVMRCDVMLWVSVRVSVRVSDVEANASKSRPVTSHHVTSGQWAWFDFGF